MHRRAVQRGEARSRGEKIFADYLESLKEDHDSRLQRADFGTPVVTLEDDLDASVAFTRLDRPYQDPVYVLINWNGCVSISGTP
jgi:hypothetical protein